ncbi:MAG TPA: carbon monoxide dehydrogenase subunit G [Thermoanaerobaculia bacterium]|nr:carbon monoxide dehydrogenase subunit G [Thermoanaerobaculia bacterium]
MKIQGSHTFDAPRERVWRALLDPDVLARTLPGCEKLERVGENDFQGVLNVQVGPVKGQFQGTLQLSNLVPLEGYHMRVDGKGPAGFMSGEGDLRLAGEGGSTSLTYDLDAQVGGRIAGVGQRLIESSAKSITRQGLEGLARELAAMGTAETTATPEAAPTPVTTPPVRPTQTEVAARVAADVARDLVPPTRRPWVIGGVLLAVIAVVLLLVRACT